MGDLLGMKIIAFTGQKGGTGKSTLALNVGLCLKNIGGAVILLDRDPQGALSSLAEDGQFCGLPMRSSIEKDIEAVAREIAEEGCDYLVIDTSPSLGGEFTEVAKMCDLMLIPTRPSRFDAQSLVNALSMLEESFGPNVVPVYALLNQVREQLRVTAEMLETIKGMDIPVLKSMVSERTIHQLALSEGESIFQRPLKESRIARDEIVKLTREIRKLVK